MTSSSSRMTRRAVLLGAGATAALAGTGRAFATPTPDAPPSTLALTSFSNIDGTPVYWYSGSPSPRTWQCENNFYITLIAWMRDLRRASPSFYGGVSYIRSLGFYVDRAGQHGAGTAMDLTGVRWSSGRVSSMTNFDHSDPSLFIRRRYLAVNATLRMWFHWTLDGWYNADHANHLHADFAELPTVVHTSARSDTVFAQATANSFLRNTLLAVDGVWGPKTNAAWNKMRNALDIGSTATDPAQYRKMLFAIAVRGFNDLYIA